MGFTFGSLIHFELIFECGVQDKSLTSFEKKFFFLACGYAVSQCCLLKMLPFPCWLVLASLSKII